LAIGSNPLPAESPAQSWSRRSYRSCITARAKSSWILGPPKRLAWRCRRRSAPSPIRRSS